MVTATTGGIRTWPRLGECVRCLWDTVHGPFHDNGEPFKVYVAGPMAGYPDFNSEAFEEAAFQMRARRHWIVFSPKEFDDLHGLAESTDARSLYVPAHDRADYLRRDIHHLTECDAIALLPGWEDSTGANIELAVARATNMVVYEYSWGNDIYKSKARPALDLFDEHLRDLDRPRPN